MLEEVAAMNLRDDVKIERVMLIDRNRIYDGVILKNNVPNK